MRFFLYGTLLPGGGHPLARSLAGVLGDGVPATVRGRLHAIPDPAGWYPALLPDPAGNEISGLVFRAREGFTPAHLAAMDAFEGHDPAWPDAGDYRRILVEVTSCSERIVATAWVWQAPIPHGARMIAGGSFEDFLAEGNAPYRGT